MLATSNDENSTMQKGWAQYVEILQPWLSLKTCNNNKTIYQQNNNNKNAD